MVYGQEGNQNFFTNQGYVGGNFGQPWGPQMQQPQQVRQTNFLTADEVQKLIKKENQFSLALTETEKLKAFCNHHKPDGSGDALVDEPDGSVRCSICGYKFRPLDAHTTTKESLQAAVEEVDDILQTIKMIFVDLDPAVAREYFQIIPLLERIPEFFERAVKNYSSHEIYNPYSTNGRNMSTAQMFAALTGFFNGGSNMFNQQYQQAPMGAAPQQQFQGQPMMGNPAVFGNGFGYMGAAPQQPQGYQSQTSGFQYTPNAQPQPQEQVANPVSQTATTDGKDVNVQATFKAN